MLAAALIVFPTLAWAAPPSTVTSGKLSWGTSPTFAPFEFQRDGQSVGFDLDMMAELAARMDELELRIAELRQQEELDRLRPDLSGDQVMTILDIGPGPAVGQALSFLMELRLDEGPLGPEEAEARLREWWAERPGG